MTYTEANRIYQVWKRWYWPFDFIIESIFHTKRPESFLPYPKEDLEEALNIIAKQCFESGDVKLSELIQVSITALWQYTKDDEAFKQASEYLANPEMREIVLINISNFKNDWLKWLNDQDDFKQSFSKI